jgi:hypothetical protein
MKVINLGRRLDLLRDWDRVREAIIKGRVHDWYVTLRDDDGAQTVFLGGIFKTDAKEAAKASMRVSWEMTKKADEQEEERQEFASSR